MATLSRFSRVGLGDWLESLRAGPVPRVLVAASGYEERCSRWTDLVLRERPELAADFLVCGFSEIKDAVARTASDDFYRSRGISVHPATGEAFTEFSGLVEAHVRRKIEQ